MGTRLGSGCFEIACRAVVSTHSLTRRALARGLVRLATWARRWALCVQTMHCVQPIEVVGARDWDWSVLKSLVERWLGVRVEIGMGWLELAVL